MAELDQGMSSPEDAMYKQAWGQATQNNQTQQNSTDPYSSAWKSAMQGVVPAQHPFYNYVFSKEPYVGILNSIKEHGNTADTMEDPTREAMVKAGLYNDYSKGEESIVKSFSEAFIRPFVMAGVKANALLSAAGGALSGAGQGMETAAKKYGRDTVFGSALGEAGQIAGAVGEGEYLPTSHGRLNFEDLYKLKASSPTWLNVARSEGAIGESQAKFLGQKEPTMDESWFRSKALGQLSPELPAPNIHDLVRQSYPTMFNEYDKLLDLDKEIRGQLQPIEDAKIEMHRIDSDPEASPEDYAKRDKLEKFVADREADPVYQTAKEDLQDNLAKIVEFSPEVKNAYREAQAKLDTHQEEATRPPEPISATPSTEVSSEGTKPSEAVKTLPRGTEVYDDVYKKMIAAGRPEEEAKTTATMWQSRYETRAARFEGKLGNANELYAKEAPGIRSIQGQKNLRGAYNRENNLIKLFPSSDPSTIFHESAHAWLEELARDAAHPDAPESIKQDLQTVRDWLKNKGEPVTRQQHEKWARGFERYLREGVAPSKGLAQVFSKLKEWLTSLYKRASDLKSPITDDMRAVYDRLLSTEDKEPTTAIEPQEGPTAPTGKSPEANTPVSAPKEEVKSGEVVSTPNEELQQGEKKFVDKAGNIRVQDITSDPDAQQAVRDVVAANKDFLDVRNGNISATDRLNFAQDIAADNPQAGMNLARTLAAKYNMPLDHIIMAVGRIMRQAAIDTAKYAEAEDMENFVTSASNLIRLTETFSGLTAEWGRAGKMFQLLYKQAAEAGDLSSLLQDMTGKDLNQTKKIMKAVATQKSPAGAAKMLKRAYSPRWGDMITEAAVNGYISGPWTHAYYAVDNQIRMLAHTFIETPSMAMVGSVGRALGRTGERVTWGDTFDGMYALATGYSKGFQAMKMSMKLGIPQGLQLSDLAASKADWEVANGFLTPAKRDARINDLIQNPTEDMRLKVDAPQSAAIRSSQKAIPGVLGSFIRAPGERFVGPIHSITYTTQLTVSMQRLISRTARLEGEAKGWTSSQITQRMAELENNTPPDLVKQARDEALQGSLMSRSNEFTRRYQWLLQTPTPIGRVFRLLEPFVGMTSKTVSLAYKGTFGTATQLLTKEFWGNINGKNGNIAMDQTIAKTALGVAFTYTIWNMLDSGTMNGSAPNPISEKETALVQEMTQGAPNSVRIGDMTYSTEKLGVTGYRISLIADMKKAWDTMDKDGMAPALMTLFWDMGHHLTQTGPISGFSDLIDAVQDPTGRKAQQYINGLITAVTLPFSVGLEQVAKKTDQYERMITADGKTGFYGEWNKLIETYESDIPGLRENLQPMVDLFGNPVPTKASWGLYAERVSQDPVYQALKNLKDPSHFPAPVKKEIYGVPLTDQQYHDYAIKSGQMLYKMLQNFITSPNFNNLTPEIQHDLIRTASTNSRELAELSVTMESRGSSNDIGAKAAKMKQNLVQGLPKEEGIEFAKRSTNEYNQSIQAEGKDHLTNTQKTQWTHLMDLFNPDIHKGAESPLSKLGAMMARDNGDVFKSFSTPLNALGITFTGPDPYKVSSDVERNLFQEMHLDPNKAEGHIGIGPEAISGIRPDVIYHELIHYALFSSNHGKVPNDPNNTPYIPPGLEEAAVRLIMLKNNLAVEDNKDFLKAEYPTYTLNQLHNILDRPIEAAEKAAQYQLNHKYGNKK